MLLNRLKNNCVAHASTGGRAENGICASASAVLKVTGLDYRVTLTAEAQRRSAEPEQAKFTHTGAKGAKPSKCNGLRGTIGPGSKRLMRNKQRSV
jgi:hypothetical protein